MSSNIFILSGPSGSGQDSVIDGLKKIIDLERIITTTTRPMRPGEINGKSYYFISREEFKKMIKENKFFEFALEDNGNYYGGTYEELERAKSTDKPVVWKVDYQGVVAGKKLVPDAKSILIYIPQELIPIRLEKRGHKSKEFIEARIEHSQGWYKNENIFDYKVYNKEGKLDETIKKIAEIIKDNISNINEKSD
jgi:guanylate kinase